MIRIGGIRMLYLLKRTLLMVRELLQLIIFPFFVSDTTYERLLSVFVGSYYVDVRTLNDMTPNVVSKDVVTTRDSLGNHFLLLSNHLLNSPSLQLRVPSFLKIGSLLMKILIQHSS